MTRKNYSFSIVLLFLFLGVSGCLKEKEFPFDEPFSVGFSFRLQTSTNKVPAKIRFENNSKSAVSYFWDFGNGETSTNPNPEVTYTEEGTYGVTLTATSSNGESRSVTDSVIISREFSIVTIRSVSVISIPTLQPVSGLSYDLDSIANLNFEVYQGGSLLFENPIDSIRSKINRSSLPVLVPADRLAFELTFFRTSFQPITIKLIDVQAPPLNRLEIGSFDLNFENYLGVEQHYPSPIALESGETRINLNIVWR